MPERSGAQWCRRFPGSRSTDDLAPAFRQRTVAFLTALRNAGASVKVNATFRPPERAYLMHWCSMVADSGQDPAKIPKMSGVDIEWLHKKNGKPDIDASRSAARAMKAGYGIKFPAALASRHTQRRAIDMTISWTGSLSIDDAAGQTRKIASAPRSGLNPALIEVGRSYGVVKLVKTRRIGPTTDTKRTRADDRNVNERRPTAR